MMNEQEVNLMELDDDRRCNIADKTYNRGTWLRFTDKTI